MPISKDYIAPGTKLVEGVVEWLMKKAREEAGGVRSLAHLLVIVPTAQSGRNLRLNLAKVAAKRGMGGLLPPKVVLPFQIVKGECGDLREATGAECAATFQQYVKSNREKMLSLDRLIRAEEFEDLTARFALFDQLQDIWHTLASNGYLMGEVTDVAKSFFDADWGDEKERWEQLAELETGYFKYLNERGLIYPTDAIHRAKTSPIELPSEIEEIVLPHLADPIKVLIDVVKIHEARGKRIQVLLHCEGEQARLFDEWGRPKRDEWIGRNRPVIGKISNEDIVPEGNVSRLAQAVAEDFPKSGELPALSICDENLFQGVASAFLKKNVIIYNPDRHQLAASSLGRLIKELVELYPEGEMPWREFAAVLRTDDVLKALELSWNDRAEVLEGLDVVQNNYLPQTVPHNFAFPKNRHIHRRFDEVIEKFYQVGRLVEAKLVESRVNADLTEFLRRMLMWIFAKHKVSGDVEDREFVAAADCVRELLNGIEAEKVKELSLSAAEYKALFLREFDEAVYSLESEKAEIIKTEGWLELAWSGAQRIALVGFHEGMVPDAIVGHPFLPDLLRKALGLVSNDDRLARDTWLLKELVDSREAHEIRAYIARTNDAGDICKPSRLLYLADDDKLANRVNYLFGELPETIKKKSLRSESVLALPASIPEPKYFSPSSLDSYIKCPFTYLLENGLQMESFKEKRELEANDFGTIIHGILEEYAIKQIALGDDQLTNREEIERILIEELMPRIREIYGKNTLNLELQLDAIELRLRAFAKKQAEWAKQGWRIRKTEELIDDDVKALGFRLRGNIDRVDENIAEDFEGQRWCLIDYKTWDKKSLSGHVFSSPKDTAKSRAQKDFGKKLGYKLIVKKTKKEVKEMGRMLSVQLPLYGLGLTEKCEEISFNRIQYRYCILGKTEDETGFSEALTNEMVEAAIDNAKLAVELIKANIFWPPGPSEEWRWKYSKLFVAGPEKDLEDTEWAKEQARRLEVYNVRG